MTLEIIGSGFGRTGTLTLKASLEQLGFGPCHHMIEVFAKPETAAHWASAARGEPVDWRMVLAGYRSQVDWPGSHFWRQLHTAFPKAKVIHSVRKDGEAWYKSFSQTILMALEAPLPDAPLERAHMEMVREIVAKQTFGGAMRDKAKAIAAYEQRTQDVRRTIPAGQLLVYDVAEGWGPLCEFLGVPVPATPMPKTNSTEEFQARIKQRFQ